MDFTVRTRWSREVTVAAGAGGDMLKRGGGDGREWRICLWNGASNL